MHIRYETDRHESACVQGTHRLQKTEHFQNRSTRIGVCARNASSAKVDHFQTGLQKSACVQVALVTTSRTCCNLVASNALHTIEKTKYADKPRIRTPDHPLHSQTP
ncbi:hypothetical protein AVEN_25525-1 [Araneus ventricosus]|uniref:Uncharacterized protein n=1 Tax=Araneus ventricosus TaxID=182803 RepID=A0A4Y2NP47_ARAVE|nr:hypothetical protein AVEN_25525-1 [Araneus ventricosus]